MAVIPHDLLVMLGDLGRLVRLEADRRARVHGMTRAQWLILARLEVAPGLSQRELAAILEVEPITVGRLVDRLEARGLVERRPDPLDRRIWRLHLLPGAQPVLEPLEGQKEAIAALLINGIAPSELERFNAVVTKMKANMATCRAPAQPRPLQATA